MPPAKTNGNQTGGPKKAAPKMIPGRHEIRGKFVDSNVEEILIGFRNGIDQIVEYPLAHWAPSLGEICNRLVRRNVQLSEPKFITRVEEGTDREGKPREFTRRYLEFKATLP
jgi:hypothetical protein